MVFCECTYIASGRSLTVSLVKTNYKGMKIGDETSFVEGVPVCDRSMEMVKKFPYLGSSYYLKLQKWQALWRSPSLIIC